MNQLSSGTLWRAWLIGSAFAVGLTACNAADTPKSTPSAGPPPAPAPVTLFSRPNAGPGEKLFIERCIMCHGANGMGTNLLARRVTEPLLEQRTDLDAEYVVQAARMGIGNMPAIPPGEVSEDELKQIADYLAHKSNKASLK